MIQGKKHFLAASFFGLIPFLCWAEAPVVDESDNFALMTEQPIAAQPKYSEPQVEQIQLDNARADKYSVDNSIDDGPALAKDDVASQPERHQAQRVSTQDNLSDNAALIERLQSLQKDLQELRGQLEVQAHDIKLLQQQQLSFYKDIDSRLSAGVAKKTVPTDISLQPAQPTANLPKVIPVPVTPTPAKTSAVTVPAGRANPADEQISYMAAYEFVKDKRYDEGISAMNTFVQKYPHGGFSANAEYWLGEMYMVKKDYAKAAAHFETVLQKFPSSNKASASMLKAAYAYSATGHNQQAQSRLQQVIKNYPGTSTAQLAQLKLDSIKAL